MASLREIAAAQRRQQILRSGLLAAEAKRAAGDMEAAVRRDVRVLSREIDAARDAGKVISRRAVQEMSSYKQVLERTRRESESYAAGVRQRVTAAQMNAMERGAEDAKALLQKLDSRLVAGQVTGMGMQRIVGTANRGRLNRLLNKFGKDAAVGMREAVLQNAHRGSTVMNARVQEQIGKAGDRGAGIVHQETMQAYRESQRQTYRATRGVGRWSWLSQLGARTCAICYSQHGKVFPLSTPMVSHVGCRCTMVPVGRDGQSPLSDGEEEFAKLDEAQQLRLLGPSRLRLYRDGLGLSEMVEVGRSPGWGQNRRYRPLRSMSAGPPVGGPPIPRARFSKPEQFSFFGEEDDSTPQGLGDQKLKRIWEEQGFNAKPHLVSKAEMDGFVKNGEVEVYRGVKVADHATQYMSGDHHAGLGVYGNGSYMATDHSGDDDALKTAYSYSSLNGSIMRITIRGDARTTTYAKLQEALEEQERERKDEIRAKLEGMFSAKGPERRAIESEYRALQKKDREIRDVVSDVGHYAAMSGYDAYYVEDAGHWVVHNRGAIRIQRDVIDPNDIARKNMEARKSAGGG